jgi:predicted nucleotidyltransferase component of viral defense system
VIDRREILAAAGNLGLLPNIVEKDYVLSWVLAGIYAHGALGPVWVFKGGTCLKKCYFETYRFSEDLDFTITDESHFDVEFLRGVFVEVSAWVYDQTGIELPPERLHFEVFTNRRGRLAGQGRVSYRGPIAPAGGDLPRIKLDLTLDEILVLPPVERRVAHPYSDDPEGGIVARCYAYEEAFAEKVRALAERARPRDLYDVINLFRNGEMQPAPAVILDVLEQKCTFKGIPVPKMAVLDLARAELEGDWVSMLGHQLPSLPPVAVFWDELPAVFSWIEGARERVVPAAYPLAAGEIVVRASAGRLAVPGMISTAPIEIVRFAASNRLCVELDYTDERGRRGVRIIEPYSLRRTQAGDVVLHALRADDGGHRSYRVERINSARTTNRAFVPRYAVELTPAGPIAAPMSERLPRIRAPRATRARRSGPVYVYECGMCGKRFERKTRGPSLRKHKSKSGWPCSGRHGILVDTKW